MFGYDLARPIFRNLTFTIPAGKKVAFVGASGAGKSTILRLLFRFYNPQAGEISVDGVPMKDIQIESLRRQIAVIPQETALFNDTIFYNIAYGNPSAKPEEVYNAAKLASISEVVEAMPKGFDTLVGERGLKLSGGEKQRVSIARAILKNSPILLMDEPTSSLDTKTEQEVMTSFRRLSEKRTTIVIAHRLSTIVDSDKIIVLGGVNGYVFTDCSFLTE